MTRTSTRAETRRPVGVRPPAPGPALTPTTVTAAAGTPLPADRRTAAAGADTAPVQVGAFLLSAQFPGQTHGEALDRTVRAAVAAEQAGLDSVWLAEHHFVPYGVCPNAATLAALLLGRTRRIGIGTAVSVLSTTHPVALGEQAALLHLTSDGRFTLGVGRGGPWIDLEVFGGGVDAFERGFPERLDLLLRWLRGTRVGAAGPQFTFPEVAVVPRATEPPRQPDLGAWLGLDERAGTLRFPRQRLDADGSAEELTATGRPVAGPPMVVACTSPGGVRTAAERGLPMLLGMHSGDEDKLHMLELYRSAWLAAGRGEEQLRRITRQHVAAGVAQVDDRASTARATLLGAMPGWFEFGLGAHRTVDGRERKMRDPHQYTELLCDLHAVGTPRQCADRLLATAERTGIRRFALLAEGSGDREATLHNIARLGSEVLPQLG
ncbi:Flavin-dependent oxidoreductase, luciferase family (includes alkanesulfonate monooxygenase SsuD and methylene tetrahydromethanopterin reductase) [Streptomyces sp. TLI_053]|uniref:LLM class flavin-dependent oxidoreductase n=1 Tax=Streptomyces sp. TLI_053 TaxID=1855352 RepID=UPI00087A84B0|nr:LLM class flavin-dependent oxidoreductase [Streptomyces sp. TLI_053]SDT60297.1 Flavin-dependent oxidoreductase, luciferase family (includes alkanesulfonate monooxygenase SsuD and methylene tetrahydromethanopterin reductase) [Streptomyces sp. TLI_053]